MVLSDPSRIAYSYHCDIHPKGFSVSLQKYIGPPSADVELGVCCMVAALLLDLVEFVNGVFLFFEFAFFVDTLKNCPRQT